MIIPQCPWCSTKHVQTTLVADVKDAASENKEKWQVLMCQNPACQRLILYRQSLTDGALIGFFPAGSYEFSSDVQSIPDEVRNDYREAGTCLDAGCYKASLVMSRRALQRCLKEQGCDQHRLVDAISTALDDGILRPAFRSLAEEIRQFGNLSAHPDDDQLQNASRDSAEQILRFVELMVEELYEIPARAGSLRRSRENTGS